MSTFKKLLALTLALAMVLSVSAFAGYKADTYADADKIDEDCEDAVELMYALDIMVGDGKNFNPEATVTRAEMAKMIYVILNYGDDDKAANYTGAKIFSDVASGAWYEGYVNYCGTTKLVQGRPDGTFGPMDPVTCAEAAKMLLTAIGYSAEERAYTGANWANNVLSDAALVGLLDGYSYNTNTYAPRQWVAVMMENALLEAYTYASVRPVTVNGLLTSSAIGKVDEDTYMTMGEKYYKLKTFTKVAVATTNASMTGDFAEDYVLFSNDLEIKGTGLGAMDLGQEYYVIYKNASTKTAYSVRSVSETAEARTLDMEVEVKYGTSSNKAANKYEFTIGDMVAKFEETSIPVLYTGTRGYADADDAQTTAGKISVTELREIIEHPYRNNNTYKAIDIDCDNTIDAMIVTEYGYGVVTKDGSHNKYGDYIRVDLNAAEGEQNMLTFNFNSEKNLYLEDTIITEDEIVEDNVVKYTWDLDEGMFVMEVLPVAEDVVYEAREKSEKIYTIDGEDYMVHDKALTEVAAWLADKDNLGEELCIVMDGDLLVYHWFSDSNLTSMDEVNAKLVLVTDAENEFSNGTIRNKDAIEYMTIDGELHVAEYQDGKGVDFADLMALGMDEYDGEEDLEGRLFILKEGTKGRVYLVALDELTINDQLDASTSLLNGYIVYGDGKSIGAPLDATGSAVKLAGNTMAADNTFFYSYNKWNSKDGVNEAVFGVITPAEFGDGKDDETYAQVLTYTKNKSARTTVLGGYVVVDLDSDTTTDYLYITEIGKETADGQELKVQFVGGEEATIYVDVANSDELYVDLLYGYTYKTMDDEYEIEIVDDLAEEKVVAWYDEEYYELKLDGKGVIDVSDDDDVDHIVLTTIEYVRDETQTDADDEDYLNDEEYKEYERVLEVVAYEDLTAEAVENGNDTDSYDQYAYWYYDGDADLVYVVVLRDMTKAQ